MTYKSAHKAPAFNIPDHHTFDPCSATLIADLLTLKEIPFLGCPCKCHIYGRLFPNTAVVGCSEKPLKKGGGVATGRRVLNVLHLHKHTEAERVACRPASQAVTLKPHVLKGSGITWSHLRVQ